MRNKKKICVVIPSYKVQNIIEKVINKIDFRLLIIGRGKNYCQMKNFIHENNLGKKIKILKLCSRPLF